MSKFVPLHVHTEYSLLDGAIKINALMEKAKADAMSAVAITDHGTLYGVIEFYKEATNAGIKPIIGCEFYTAPDGISTKSSNRNHMVVLAQNREGYENLVKLATVAFQKGFHYKPRIDIALLQQFKGGLIGLSACIKGRIPELIIQGKVSEAEDTARQYQEIFGEDNFFLEVQRNGIEVQDQVNAVLLDMSKRLSIPLVATNDCHYLEKEDAHNHDILLCIQTKTNINNPKRFKFPTDQFYFKSQQEMIDAFTCFPGAIENTVLIANRCNVEFDFKTYHFPKVNDDSKELLVSKANAGLEKNVGVDIQTYKNRLDYELGVICSMDFADYFLIVADFIEYARANDIPVGPGRGSAAGSLVAYALGITAIDPLKYDLLFERFLNPERISMPDIDVDFCKNGRERVIQYIKERYGAERVAPIISFGKMQARAVIRDVGRSMDMPSEVNENILTLVPKEQDITLQEVIDREPALLSPKLERFMMTCKALEGMSRNKSNHPSAIVISDKALTEYLPLETKDSENLTQYDMYSVESIGLVKFDLLGLNTLTIIDMCLASIASQYKSAPDLSNIDLSDNATYAQLSSGETVGVFQSEKPQFQNLLRAVKPESFSDVVALMALNRPGPLNSGMANDFSAFKHGIKQIEYLLPELEPILKETYGVILYQEQVMRIASELAGYSLAEADMLRKAIGKKKPEIMAEHRKRFLEGCRNNRLDENKASLVYNHIEKFGDYGFNKSHSAAYVLITFQTAYLKAHYPVEYMAACLSCAEGDLDKIKMYISECRRMGIVVLPPDVNYSSKKFTIENGRIRFGLIGIKNIGSKAVDEIVKARQIKQFTFLSDFIKRVDNHALNYGTTKQLINSGSFNSLGTPRENLLAELDKLKNKKPSDSNPVSETEIFGFYIAENPLVCNRSLLEALGCIGYKEFSTAIKGRSVRVAGIIKRVFPHMNKKHQEMCFVDIECLDGMINATMFSDRYAYRKDRLKEEAPMILKGKIEYWNERKQLILDDVMSIDEAAYKFATSVIIRVDKAISLQTAERLLTLIQNNPGSNQVLIVFENDVISVNNDLTISADKKLRQDIQSLPGVSSVDVVFV